MLRRLIAAITIVASLAVPVAQAGPGLVIGVNDDTPKWRDDPALASRAAELGVGAYRLTMGWNGSQTVLADTDRALLERAVANVHGKRILLSVFGAPDTAPQTDAARTAYCQYVGAILATFPAIRTIGIWNEVNKASFWRPQFNGTESVAPGQYVRLLAACSGLRATFPDLVLVSSISPRGNDKPNARSNVSHSPVRFIEGMGAAARSLEPTVRLFDHFGQNVYGITSSERPFRSHPRNTDMAQGDYAKLMAALTAAFSGTAQPVPGTDGVTVWYLETGFQTSVPAEKRGLYSGSENDRRVLEPTRDGADPARTNAASDGWDQASQLADAIRLAFCQPAVGAFFNFQLADESNLAGWQSGILWADGTPKPSFDAVKRAIAEVSAGTLDCAELGALVGPGTSTEGHHRRHGGH